MTYFPLSSLTFSLLLLFEMSGVGDGTTHLIGDALRYSLSRLQCSGCLSGGCTCYHAPRSQAQPSRRVQTPPSCVPRHRMPFLAMRNHVSLYSHVEASTHEKRIRIYNKERGKNHKDEYVRILFHDIWGFIRPPTLWNWGGGVDGG